MSKNTKQFLIGSEWESNYGRLVVVDYINKSKILVRFLLTGFEKYTNASSIRSGSVKDPYYPTVAKVGCIGNTTASINGKVKTSYHTWRGMLSRCYEYKKSTRTYFGKVTVAEVWWCYEVFEKWFDENYIEGYKLDKDLTILGSTTYSPETCSFIPNKINCLLGKKDTAKGDLIRHSGLPVGVSYHVRDDKYTSQCFDGEKLQHFGYHDTPESAFLAYKEFKERLLRKVAEDAYNKGEINKTVYENLHNYEITP